LEFVETIPREFNRLKVYTFQVSRTVAGSGVDSYAGYDSLTLDEDVIFVGADMTMRTSEASDGHAEGICRGVISHVPNLNDGSSKEPVWANLAIENRTPFAKVEFKERYGAYIKMKAEETIHIYFASILRNLSAADAMVVYYLHLYGRVKG